MAGFLTKLNGHVYNGENKANAALTNGTFVEIGANGVVAITAAGDLEARVVEKTTLWGMPAIRCDVVVPGSKEQYFLENEWCNKDDCTYNTAEYTCAVGDYVKMKRLLEGEQFIMTVTSSVAATLAVGDTVKPAVGGSVAKKSA